MPQTEQFKRGDLVTVRSCNRTMLVHHVVEVNGKVMLDCKADAGDASRDGLYHPHDLTPCIGLKRILPPE